MTKYKVGDVASLFSKPKSPTTTGGKKLQSLFEDYYSKKSNSAFHPQETSSKGNENGKNKETNEESVSKRKRKRKLSSQDDSELTEGFSSKKFKGSFEQKDTVDNKFKTQKMKGFPKKKKNFKFIDNSNNFNNKSHKKKETLDQIGEKFKTQQDFPRKKKLSEDNLLTANSMFPKFEAEPDSENESEPPSVPKFKNVRKENTQTKSFIKKSKKKQSIDQSNYDFSNDISGKDSYDSDDTSLKREIENFIHNNSVQKEMKRSNNFNEQKAFNLKGHEAMGKRKKKLMANDNSSEELEESSDQIVKHKKKNKSNISPSKTSNFLEQDRVKKSKKPKHKLNVSNINCNETLDNNSETNTSKAKAMDFIRKPKNKTDNDNLYKDTLKKTNINTFNDGNDSESFKSNESNFNNKLQKGQTEVFEGKAPDFIKLPSLNEDDEKSYEERLSRTLFVGNLPKNISKQELKNLFASFGVVAAVRLPGIETDKAKIFGKNPPKLLNSNYASETIPAFVVFKEKQSADEAVKLSGSVFKGHHITVDFALPAGTHKLYDGKRSIFIGNLPFNVKDESIWNAFNHCGRIEGVRVVRDRKTGLGKGFGYVLFSTVEAKQNALALENLNIEGREIRIKPVDSNKNAQKSSSSPSTRKDTFKSRALRIKKNMKATHGHKTIRKLTNKQKMMHKKRKTAEILQKVMK